jgi:hypothetical protein
MALAYDGYASHYLNRGISRPVARLLSHTPATPNQVSLLSLCIAAGAFVAFVMGYPIAGGLLAQTSSVADGVEGPGQTHGAELAFRGLPGRRLGPLP